MRNDIDADDIIQNTLVEAVTGLTQFRFEATFRTGLIQIAINEIRQLHRERVYSRAFIPTQAPIAERQPIDQSPSPFENCERHEMAEQIDHALGIARDVSDGSAA